MGQALSFFPAPADDETIYSACARFHQLAGRSNSESSSELLLGHAVGGSEIDLVSGLQHLQEASYGLIPCNLETLRQRSVLRAYLPFMSAARRRQVLTACSSSQSPLPIRAERGLTWSCSMLEHHLRACPECAAEHLQAGFAYWVTGHQLPGVWVCLRHRCALRSMCRRGHRNMTWATVAGAKFDVRPEPSRDLFAALCNISTCVEWLSAQPSVNLEVLLMQFRSRMRESGFSRSDVKVTDEELRQLHELMHLTIGSGIPHFAGYDKVNWIRLTVRDLRFAHPLHWAMLLAFSGDACEASLAQEYADAQARLPELELFEDPSVTRRACAPASLYKAMEQFERLEICAQRSSLRIGEVQRWLLRDPALAEHRKASEFKIKHRAATQCIEGALLHNPSLTRVGVLRRVPWAFRWLEAHDPELLGRLTPAPYGRQRTLFSSPSQSHPCAAPS
ncbi:TniQ family protein [Roseateles sp.]|uniref:TniQ family protein n=1 Tax=Roseateles sp. TaxID=1971397 RepID=UPI003D0ED5CA